MIRALAILLLCCAVAPAQESRWKGLTFLLGNWVGVGDGTPGAGSGKFSFQLELSRQVLVRHSFNQPAKGDRHDDMLVIYAEGPLRAMYFDSEGHVIRYKVSTPVPGRVVFESEGEGPRYRLSYWLEGKLLKGKFEVGDRTYLEWGATKENAK